MNFIKIVFLIIIVHIINLLPAEVNVTPITHFAQAQHYGYEAITISDSIIVCKSVTGIDLYLILSDNDISLASHLDILNPITMKVNNNYVYISSWMNEYSITRFSQIDISNISQPEIIQQLDFNYSERQRVFEIFNSDKLFMYENHIDSSVVIHVYDLPEMEFSNSFELDIGILYALNDSIGWNYDYAPSHNLRIWDVSNPLQIELIEEVDMTQYHGLGFRPKEFVIYDDSLLAASGKTSISFWDISDFTEWEYITQLDYPDGFNENNMCPISVYYFKLITSDNHGLALYNIADLDNIELLDFIEGEISNHQLMNTTYFKMRDNFLYVTGLKDGVHRYEISENSINYLETYLEMPLFFDIIANGCTIIAHSLDYGIYFFDLSDPENPITIPNFLPYDNGIYIYYKNNNLAVSYEIDGSYYFELYDISDPYNVFLISQYTLDLYEVVISANEDCNEIFIQNFNFNNPYFRKAAITQAGNLENIYTFNLPSTNFKIKDDYGYYLTSNREMIYLDVLIGLNSDYPELINSIEIGNYAVGSIFFTINNSLLQFNSFNDEVIFFYDTINPTEPQFLTELSLVTYSSGGLVYNNYYFSVNSNTSFIYDLNNPPPVVYPIDQVTSHTNIIRIKEMVNNIEEYLIVNNQGSLEVWALNITQGAEDNISIAPINISNYPNPFNPETTISFSIPYESKVELLIYNIKGQKVETLLNEHLIKGTHSVVWNGIDSNNKLVSSGIYFYKISSGKESVMKKMLLLK